MARAQVDSPESVPVEPRDGPATSTCLRPRSPACQIRQLVRRPGQATSSARASLDGTAAWRRTSPKWLVIPTSPTTSIPSSRSRARSTSARSASSPSATSNRRNTVLSPGTITEESARGATCRSWSKGAPARRVLKSSTSGPRYSNSRSANRARLIVDDDMGTGAREAADEPGQAQMGRGAIVENPGEGRGAAARARASHVSTAATAKTFPISLDTSAGET